jgi:hypothetical protein
LPWLIASCEEAPPVCPQLPGSRQAVPSCTLKADPTLCFEPKTEICKQINDGHEIGKNVQQMWSHYTNTIMLTLGWERSLRTTNVITLHKHNNVDTGMRAECVIALHMLSRMCDRTAHAQIRIAIHALLETKKSSCLDGCWGRCFSQRPYTKNKAYIRFHINKKIPRAVCCKLPLNCPWARAVYCKLPLNCPCPKISLENITRKYHSKISLIVIFISLGKNSDINITISEIYITRKYH